MDLWHGRLLGMALLGLAGTPLLMWWVQRAPIWMHARWAEEGDGPPPISQPISYPTWWFMAVGNTCIWVLCSLSAPAPTALVWAVFGSGLLLLAVIDARSGWLPDVFTLGLLGLGLCVAALGLHHTGLAHAVWGAAGGYAVLWLSAWGFRQLTGREGLGGGDPKLFAAIGAWMGWEALPSVLLCASVAGAMVGLCMQRCGLWPLNTPFAFGPFLAGAAAAVAALGPDRFAVFFGG
jgi:prepilin signal peptidase PulO-like enzyme (type II secretory pathway)